MNSTGNIGFGTTPNSTYIMNTYGKVRVDCGNYSNSIVFDNTGYMGTIGMRPSSHLTGSVGNLGTAFKTMYADNFINISDQRIKENIRDIESPLNKILEIKGYKYDLKKEYSFNTDTIKNKELKDKIDKKRKDKLGFLAQEIQHILPEAVVYDDTADVYGVNYVAIIPVLVEAIKEQQSIIDNLVKEVQKNKNSNKSSEIGSTEQNLLCQNAPNPFTETTTISYNIAENVKNAMLNIYNMSGTQLKSIAIHQTGIGSVTINGSEFGAGMYMYALIADGNIVDTKNMILTD